MVSLTTSSEHLKNIYGSGELDESATLRKLRRVRREGSDEKVGDFIVVSKDGGFTIGIKTWYGYTIYQERPIITTYTIAQQWVDALNAKKANVERGR